MTPWSPSKTLKALDRIDTCAKALRETAPEVARRAASPGPAADGYGVGKGADAVGVAGGGVSDPTWASVVGVVPTDEVAELYAQASEGMRLALAHLTASCRAVARATEVAEASRGRQIAASPCSACAVGSATRRGLCDACYAAWLRAARPELVAWVDADGVDRLRWEGIDPARLEGEARPGRRARA